MYGGRIILARPENAEIGRNCGVSHRQDRPARLRCRRPSARHLPTVALVQALDDLTPEEFYQQHQKAGNLEFTGV